MGTNVLPQIMSRNWYNTVITVRNYILGKPVFLSAKAWTEEIKHTNRMKLDAGGILHIPLHPHRRQFLEREKGLL